jgi:hypothetical protein
MLEPSAPATDMQAIWQDCTGCTVIPRWTRGQVCKHRPGSTIDWPEEMRDMSAGGDAAEVQLPRIVIARSFEVVGADHAVCVESVSITCSSLMRSSWTVSFMPMVSTSIKPGHIKASDNRSQNTGVSLCLWIIREARSSHCHSWVDYTTMTAAVLELLRVCDGADGCVVWSAPHLEASRPSFLFAVFH